MSHENRALKVHNMMRANHQAPAMSLDRELCTYSQNWAKELAKKGQFAHSKCTMKYQGQENTRVGENIFMGMCPGRSIEEFAEDACWGWYKEIEDYNFNKGGFSSKTGHFTQLVWKGSTKLGVGAAMNPKTNYCYVVCNYATAGNITNAGMFDQNVSPGNQKLAYPPPPVPAGAGAGGSGGGGGGGPGGAGSKGTRTEVKTQVQTKTDSNGKVTKTTTTITTTFDIASGKKISEKKDVKTEKS